MQGITWWAIDDKLPPHRSGIYMIDLSSNDTATKLVNITFEGSYRETNSPDFTPHGMSHWVTKNGEMILYIINHRHRGDTVDSFVYNPQKKSLKYRNSFEDPLLYNLNNLVVVDLDKFYVTVDHYFIGKGGRTAEELLRLPLGKILFVDGSAGRESKIKVAMDGLKYPNGIARSNDHRYKFAYYLHQNICCFSVSLYSWK
jgi:arylesterase/paraoxonase